jgi:hypothetical protein
MRLPRADFRISMHLNPSNIAESYFHLLRENCLLLIKRFLALFKEVMITMESEARENEAALSHALQLTLC